jgi:IgA Peptidase M64/Peptidase M64 N-terminus
MKSLTIYFSIIFLAMMSMSNAQGNFKEYFINKTMRIDYFHIGDAKDEIITIDKIYQYGIWAGNLKNLIDNFNNGKYYYKIYDLASGKLIFSKGFNSYFGEYQISSEAINGIKHTYSESAIIPYPKNKFKFVIERRKRDNQLEKFFETEINPDSIGIIRESVLDNSIEIYKKVINGDPHSKVDVVILSEGYTETEKKKFESDLEHFTKIFFSQEPYKSYKNFFNIYGVFKASKESGADEPRADIYKNTVLNSTFNSLGSERYLLTEDNKAMRDMAGQVPYDAIYIMVNHKRYGGGGIYNFFCTFISDNQWSPYIFLHEFGHSFAGLADEYYTSDVAYSDFYPQGIEPVEPNITALLNSPKVKWENLISPVIQIPTPWEKVEYDSVDLKWQSERRRLNNKIAELKKKKAQKEQINKLEEEYILKDKEHADWVDKYLSKSKFKGKVGAFEGAGYVSKGLYRPMLDCIMFTKGKKPFCKVCEEAIIKVIKFYTE